MRRTLLLTIAAACSLSACIGDEDEQTTFESTKPSAMQSSSAPVESAPPAPQPDLGQPSEGVTAEMTDEVISAEPVPTTDETSQRSAQEAAVAVMEAFAHPEREHEEWWAELEPMLTDNAAEAYYYVEPAQIPVSEITGEATIATDESAYVHLLEVPTNVGTYEVLMIREGADDPWRAERLTPPREP